MDAAGRGVDVVFGAVQRDEGGEMDSKGVPSHCVYGNVNVRGLALEELVPHPAASEAEGEGGGGGCGGLRACGELVLVDVGGTVEEQPTEVAFVGGEGDGVHPDGGDGGDGGYGGHGGGGHMWLGEPRAFCGVARGMCGGLTRG